MATTVTYKGQTLATVENQTKTLQTKGTWCEDDFTLTDVTQGGGITIDDIIERNITGDVVYDGTNNIPAYCFTSTKISSFNAPNATGFGGGFIFSGCSELTTVSMIHNANNSESHQWLFSNCHKLTRVTLPAIKYLGESAFQNDTSLANIALPSILRTPNKCFQNCTSLVSVDLGNPDRTNNNTFNGCTSLTNLIIRRTSSVCSLSNVNSFTNTPFASGGTGGTVYVPQALISSYQTASNWSTLYSAGTCNFVAIEGSIYETQYADGTVIS